MDSVRRYENRTLLTLVLAGFVATLSACGTVGPKYVKPAVTVNQDWTTESDARVAKGAPPDAAWWHTFNDPALDRLIDLAYRQNLPLRVAGLRIAESRAQLAYAAGTRWPQVQQLFGEANVVGLSNDSANVRNFDRNFVTYSAGFDAAWELDFWGKYKNIDRAAGANYAVTIADYENALVTLSAEVARTYALIRTYEVLITQARENVSVQEEGFRIAESRFRNGATSELDVAQAQTLLENTRSTIPQLEISLRQAENALATLIGQPTGTVAQLLADSKGIPAAPAQVAVSVPADLLRRRPDVRSAEFVAMEQSARIGIATADLYPSFSLVGTLGVGGATANNANSGVSLFYSFGPRITLPFLDYGRTRNRIRTEDARFEQAVVSYQQTVLVAAQEVEDGMVGYLKSLDAAGFAANAAAAAKRSSDIAFVQYREGAVDFQRVLDSMRVLLEQQNLFAEQQSATTTNLIALYKALGGGWEISQGQPFIPETTRKEMENRTRWGDLLSTPPPATEVPNTDGQESHHE